MTGTGIVKKSLLSLVCAAMLLAGCESRQPTESTTDSTPKATPTYRAPAGSVSTSVAIPTGDRSTSGLYIQKTAPGEVSLGQEYSYTLKVTNLTGASLNNVQIVEELGSNYKLASSSPEAKKDGKMLVWDLGSLNPRQTMTLTVTGEATGEGQLKNCVTGSYELAGCLVTSVTKPALKVTKEQTPSVLVCDVIEYKATVTNNGSGVARGVKIVDELPAGLTTSKGESVLSVDLGDLNPGKSKTVTTKLKAAKSGNYESTVKATAAGGLKSNATKSTKVSQPKLAITKTGTKKLYAGSNIDYTISVSNTGDGVAKNVTINDGVPAGTTFVSASNGGKVSNNSVTWKLGDLQPGAKKTVTLKVKANKILTVHNAAAATADCADAVTAKASTVVEGVPAILLEVVDINDPVELGETTTYVITATNQGTASDTNIKIVANLEAAQQFVGTEGSATAGTFRNGTVTFGTLAELKPGAKATWRVNVKAGAAPAGGRVYFEVKMDTDGLGRSVEEDEATTFYEKVQ